MQVVIRSELIFLQSAESAQIVIGIACNLAVLFSAAICRRPSVRPCVCLSSVCRL